MATHPDTLRRQWLTLQVLPRYPGKITATELAERLRSEGYDVTKRTVERDLVALSEDFPLVCDDRAKPFGWSWQKDAKQFSVPGMSPLQAMVLNLARTHMRPLLPVHLLESLQPYINQADATLREAFGRHGVTDWHKHVAVVQPTQTLLPPRVNRDAMALVHEAVASQRQIDMRYRSRSADKPMNYHVHPLGLVYRGVVGYLVGTIGDFDDPRQLALHRIDQVRLLDEQARRPDGFDLQDYAQSGAFGFLDNGPIKLVLRIEAPAAAHLYETPLSQDQNIVADEREGWLRILATVHDTSQLRWWLMGFGDQMEVVAPSKLRRTLVANLSTALALYGL